MKKLTKQEYLQDMLEQRIRGGKLPPGGLLPSEREIGEEFAVSRVTVRLALSSLVRKNKIRPIRGRGYVILEIPQEPKPRTMNIGGVWASTQHEPCSLQLFQPAAAVAEEMGFHMFLSFADLNEELQAAKISGMLEKNPSGILLIPIYSKATNLMTLANHHLMKTILRSGLPLLLMDRPFPEADLPCVVNDDAAGGTMAAQHFISRGHKKILVLEGDYHYYLSKLRMDAFRKRCDEAGVEVLIETVKSVPWTDSQREYECLRTHVLERIGNYNTTGFFPIFAEFRNQFLNDAGFRSQDLLVYDFNVPYITGNSFHFVRRPLDAISRRAGERLIRMIRGADKEDPLQEKIPPEIVKSEGFKNFFN